MRRYSGPVPVPAKRIHYVDQSGPLRFEVTLHRIMGMPEPRGGWGELVAAIERGDYDALLNEGSPIFGADETWPTPTVLAVAARLAPIEVVRALLDRGADPRVCSGVPDVAKRQPSNPVDSAAWEGRIDVVRLLIERGADVDVGEPIAAAVSRGDREMFELLVGHGARCDVMVGPWETLLQLALGSFGTTKATSAGITDRIRDILRSDPSRPRKTCLEVVRSRRRTPGPFSPFGRPRLGGELTWLLFAIEGAADGVARAAAEPGAGVVEDVADQVVSSNDATFVLKLRECAWTWVLAAPQVPHAIARRLDTMEFASRVSSALGRSVLAFRGMEIDEYRGGKLVTMTGFSPESVADELKLRAVTRAAEDEALARVDRFCLDRGLWLPELERTGDGLDVQLRLSGVKREQVERLDAILR